MTQFASYLDNVQSPKPTTIAINNGYVLDILHDVTEHLAVELAAAISEEQLTSVSFVISSMGQACGILESERRELPSTAVQLVQMYEEKLSKETH